MITEEKRYCIARLRPLNSVMIEKVVMSNLEWSIAEVMSAVDLEDYRYFWFETIDLLVERGDGIYTCKTNVCKNSGRYFINAYIEEYSDVLVNNQHLANQMTNMNWTHIVRSIAVDRYWTEVFDPEQDTLINPNGEIV